MDTDSDGSASCIKLPWDSEFFGYKIARLRPDRLSPTILHETMAWCLHEGVRCLYFYADGRCIQTISLACEAGFKYVDVRLNLDVSVSSKRLFRESTVVRAAAPGDLVVLQEIAKMSHFDTRFFKDDGFSVDRVKSLYAKWICRDFSEHRVLVAIVDCASGSEIGGYITCEICPSSGCGRIGLLAVRDSHRGKGLGRSLVSASLNLFALEDCPLVEVTTQASNIAAQRLYQSFGFRTRSSGVWYHKWFNPGLAGQSSRTLIGP